LYRIRTGEFEHAYNKKSYWSRRKQSCFNPSLMARIHRARNGAKGDGSRYGGRWSAEDISNPVEKRREGTADLSDKALDQEAHKVQAWKTG
jgi:hypothetical protein